MTDLKTGTKRSAPTPVAKTSFPRGARSWLSSSIGSVSPWISGAKRPMRATGTASDTKLGRKTEVMVLRVLMLPLIQSMVVVTSPMGVQAPPEFAARTIAAPKNFLLSGSFTSFRSRDTITMVLVRLSKIALMKKEMKDITQSKDSFDLALMAFVTSLKPWWESTISTMVIAPIRKKIISLTSATCSLRFEMTAPASPSPSMRIVHRLTAMMSPTPELLKARLCGWRKRGAGGEKGQVSAGVWKRVSRVVGQSSPPRG